MSRLLQVGILIHKYCMKQVRQYLVSAQHIYYQLNLHHDPPWCTMTSLTKDTLHIKTQELSICLDIFIMYQDSIRLRCFPIEY